jgi:DNA polymerase III alpha subunit
MKIDSYGQAILSSDNLRELILQGKNISHLNVITDNDIILYNEYKSELLKHDTVFLDTPEETLSFDEFHTIRASEWLLPIEFQNIDVFKWLIDKCTTQEQINRVKEEYELFEERDLIMLLRLFIFLIDYMRKNKFVWGVGRGSSTSSYILYLIGTHRVDGIRYKLDIRDFLK